MQNLWRRCWKNISKRIDGNISEETLNAVVELITTTGPRTTPKVSVSNSSKMEDTDKKAKTLINEGDVKIL